MDFLRTDLPHTFKNSLFLALAYTLLIPVVRGISNLDSMQSADVFGQSLAPIGIFLLIPITSQELETAVKEIVYTKAWSYRKSVSIRLICGFLLIAAIMIVFAGIMRIQNCDFPFLEYISVTVLYAVFLGLSGLLFSQIGSNVMIGYLFSSAYWSFCQFKILKEETVFYVFSIINGEICMKKLLILVGINSLLAILFFSRIKYAMRYEIFKNK